MQALSDLRAAFNVIKRYRSIYPSGRLERVLQDTDFGAMIKDDAVEEEKGEES